MTQNELILQMRNIRKTFPGVIALDDVSLDLGKGEVHVLLGQNGAGKSTLTKILSGAYQKTGGWIKVDGRAVEINSPKHAQDLGISIIYQELNLVPQLSAGENIFLGREPTRFAGIVNYRKLHDEAQSLLDGLRAPINSRTMVRKLGIAEQQMVEIAKALSLDARILIMDEPTSALTEHEIRELFVTVGHLKAKGVSIIYISHRLEEVFEIGDRVTVLRDGRNAGTSKIDAVDKSELIRLMAGREIAEQFPKKQASVREEVLRIEKLSCDDRLRDVSLSLSSGEILGVAGLLGSGRTELARVIFGLTRVDSGQIYVHAKKQNIRSPRTAIKLGIGYLTEDRKSEGLILTLSVKDNIVLPSLSRVSRFGVVDFSAESRMSGDFVNELRIRTPGLDQKVVLLSGGNQQKVVLAKWLCSRADILVLDEPTRGIDAAAKVEIYQLMNELTARGVAILLISSELPEILGMSDRILVMRQGMVVGRFTAGEADQEQILHCALGEERGN